jgi:hypothetical protein
MLRTYRLRGADAEQLCNCFKPLRHPSDFGIQKVDLRQLIIQPRANGLAALVFNDLDGLSAHRTKISAFFVAPWSSKKSFSPWDCLSSTI